ncbi:S24 family peptidase [Alkalicella caledoniensis]|uniref:S24 family peptidase n=1 Tax=Alkalicella caledoniensis TaxID=2731377 RepID=A0A7G9W8F7_ALKCA|nr:S24 family peptidase [Alkalicella caledoniensis]QNO14969.1 S24 family peptidase [Alkalicella caledoniensis]
MDEGKIISTLVAVKGDKLIFKNSCDVSPLPNGFDADYAYVAKDDAMESNKIRENSTVLVSKTLNLRNGDIALVVVEGNIIIRKFTKSKKMIVLEADNSAYPTIIRSEELVTILGRLSAVFHKFD